MRGPFSDFGNKVFIVVGVVLLTIGWIFTFIRIQQVETKKKELRNIGNFKKIVMSTKGSKIKLNSQQAKKLLTELKKEEIPAHHSHSIEPRIDIKIVLPC